MLAQNSWIDGKVKQLNILSLDSDIELLNTDVKNEVLLLLKAKIFVQELAFPIQNQISIDLVVKYF